MLYYWQKIFALHEARNAMHTFDVTKPYFHETMIVHDFIKSKTNETNSLEKKMRIKSFIISGLLTTLIGGIAIAQDTQTAKLKVYVEGIESDKGQILATLCKKEEFLKSKCEYSAQLNLANNSEHILVFENIKTGEYALQLFHDVNNDFKLQTNVMGIPTEPFAFSNNAKGKFGPPKFEQAAFEVTPETEITVTFEQ